MKKMKGAVQIGVIAATVLGAALLALGIGFMAPSGEQSKLVYTGDLWCVSNFIAKEPIEYSKDGRPATDPLLSGKDDWIVREQVKAKDKAEAEQKAKTNGHGLFEPSEKTRLRQALQNNERDFFTSHFNQGATAPGPCLGSGSLNHQIGSWLKEQISKKCGRVNENTGYEIVNKIRVSLTTYSPCMKDIGNICDCVGCPGHITADTSGKFQVVDGTLQWVKAGKAYKHLFAEPQTDNIIPWADRNRLAVVIVGYDNNTPIYVRDHYGKGVHEGKNYLDLFTPCPLSSAGNVLSKLPSKRNGTYEALIVDTTKPKSKPTGETAHKSLPDGTACPDSNAKTGPSEGQDFQITLAKEYERQMSLKNPSASGGNEGVAGSGNSAADNGNTQSSGVSTSGDSTVGNNGVPLFRQGDSRWGLKSYGCNGTTIKSSGCGTTSAAMVLKYYGANVDPAIITDFSLRNGYRACGQGTSYSLFPAIAKKYGLNSRQLDWNGVIGALKNNQPVIASMNDNEFSSGGHFIVLTGIDSNGKILINDPGPRKISSSPMNTVKSRMKAAFLIYK